MCLKPPSGQRESLLKVFFFLLRATRRFLLKYTYRNYLGNIQTFKAISLLIGLSGCRSVVSRVLREQERVDKF